MPESSSVLFILIGLAAGLLSGVFGIGGGVVNVPAAMTIAAANSILAAASAGLSVPSKYS